MIFNDQSDAEYKKISLRKELFSTENDGNIINLTVKIMASRFFPEAVLDSKSFKKFVKKCKIYPLNVVFISEASKKRKRRGGERLLDDLAILELFRIRSEEAIKQCQKKYADYCYSISYGILQNKEDAEECVNDTFLQAWDSIPPAMPEHLKAYLGSIARNLSINRVKAQTRIKRGEGMIPLDISELSEVISQPGSIWEKIDEELLMKEINGFLKEQKKLYRIVFAQKYWYLLDIKRIAELNRISESKVGSILHRMRKKLKKRLEKEGYTI